MILYCNARSLDDIRAGKATTISVSLKPFTMNNEIALYTEDEALGLAQSRTAMALERIAEAIENGAKAATQGAPRGSAEAGKGNKK